jgi:hypothetical protein
VYSSVSLPAPVNKHESANHIANVHTGMEERFAVLGSKLVEVDEVWHDTELTMREQQGSQRSGSTILHDEHASLLYRVHSPKHRK